MQNCQKAAGISFNDRCPISKYFNFLVIFRVFIEMFVLWMIGIDLGRMNMHGYGLGCLITNPSSVSSPTKEQFDLKCSRFG